MVVYLPGAAVTTLVVTLSLASMPLAAQKLPPPGEPTLTLAAALAQAKVQSPLRLPARSLVVSSAEAAMLAGRPLNPLVEFRTENWGPGRSQLPLDIFATVTQSLETGGKRAARLGIATAEREFAGANLVMVDRQITLRTVQLYVHALRARGVLDSLRLNREGLATLIASVKHRVDEGYSAESDLLRFETEAARLEIDIARAAVDLERSLGALAVTIGAPAPLIASQLVEPMPLAPPRGDAASIAAAVARHPEVLTADARIIRARQQGELEHARRLPDPIITAGYKRTGGFDSGVAAVMMTMPLFDRNGANVARARGEESAAAAERELTVRRLASEATALISVARTLTARADRAPEDLLQPAESVRNAALATFREGTADVLKLIDAERVYADVRRAALELRLEALAATLEARLALGEETPGAGAP
jgi:cobalt-zinc-cadmium efflux system outer membrane protein